MARWGLLKPLYGLSTARRDWFDTLKRFATEKLGAEANLLDKSFMSRMELVGLASYPIFTSLWGSAFGCDR